MVEQRFRICSVLGLLGIVGALSLEPAEPELCELPLESRRARRPCSGLLLPLDGCPSSSTPPRLVVDSLSEDDRLNSLLVRLKLWSLSTVGEVLGSDWVSGSERTSKDRALWRRPVVEPGTAAKCSCRPCSSIGVDDL